MNKSNKAKEISKAFSIEKASFEDQTEHKRQKDSIEQASKFMVGNKGDVANLFNVDKDEFEASSFSFSESTYEEKRAALDSVVPESAYILDRIKSIYDWSILVDILKDENYISFAKVKQFDLHAKNLKTLRSLIIKYCDKSVYKEFFNDEKAKHSYPAYVGFVKKNEK